MEKNIFYLFIAYCLCLSVVSQSLSTNLLRWWAVGSFACWFGQRQRRRRVFNKEIVNIQFFRLEWPIAALDIMIFVLFWLLLPNILNVSINDITVIIYVHLIGQRINNKIFSNFLRLFSFFLSFFPRIRFYFYWWNVCCVRQNKNVLSRELWTIICIICIHTNKRFISLISFFVGGMLNSSIKVQHHISSLFLFISNSCWHLSSSSRFFISYFR